MSELSPSGHTISGNISNVSGQAAVGIGISQIHASHAPQSEMTEADRATLQQLLAALTTQVETQAPPEKKASALERVEELKAAVTAEKPDLTTMEYVKNWFVKYMPTLSGAVTSLVVHPLVGKLVEAAGESLAADFRQRFGIPK